MKLKILQGALGLLIACVQVRATDPVPVAVASPAGQLPRLPLERHLTLAPSPGNGRNSEGDFIRLKDGRWLFIYSHFTGGADDHSRAILVSRESVDGGKTWSGKDKTVVANEGGLNVMSVSLLRLASGEIALFYARKNSLEDCRPMMRVSTDETKSWGEARECIAGTGYYVLNNNRVIQLASGRLVMPVARHDFVKKRLQAGQVMVYLSDDSGKSWRRSASVLSSDGAGTRINLMEPGVVETGANGLLMLIRTELGCQYMSESIDGGETWATPRPTELLSPIAPATLARIPTTGDLLVVWNDHEGQPEEYRRRRPPIRTPLAAAISRDGGRTWERRRSLEDAPDHGYCYTAVAFAGDRVLLGYCAGRAGYGLETAQVSSFSLEELYR